MPLDRAVITTLLSGIVLLGAGCHLGGCTDIGWIEGLTVYLVRDDGNPMPSGEYELEIDGDLEHTQTFAISNYPGRLVCGDCRNLKIEAAPGAQYSFVMTLMFDSSRLWLILTRLDRDGRGAGGPQRVSLRLLHEGVVVGEATLTPRYHRDEINGPGCGVATTATETMTVVFPP